jgi:hypothetical protein
MLTHSVKIPQRKGAVKSSGGTDEVKTVKRSAGIFVQLDKDLEKKSENQDRMQKKDSRGRGGFEQSQIPIVFRCFSG